MIPVAYCIFELMFYLIPVQQEYLFNQTGTCYSEFNLGKGCLGRVESMWASGQEIVAADCMESFNCTDTDVCWFILPSIHKVTSYVFRKKNGCSLLQKLQLLVIYIVEFSLWSLGLNSFSYFYLQLDNVSTCLGWFGI